MLHSSAKCVTRFRSQADRRHPRPGATIVAASLLLTTILVLDIHACVQCMCGGGGGGEQNRCGRVSWGTRVSLWSLCGRACSLSPLHRACVDSVMHRQVQLQDGPSSVHALLLRLIRTGFESRVAIRRWHTALCVLRHPRLALCVLLSVPQVLPLLLRSALSVLSASCALCSLWLSSSLPLHFPSFPNHQFQLSDLISMNASKALLSKEMIHPV